ncbi:hypothetical protein JG687_00017809 [Phytophthora cactorum]|uniref:Uncharacterized protein n=1 Tax=Phytophthora cactorum TaxID=29920 RepID=A0A8T1TPF0_9STRA|nr:hypothetical protein JG687_00017809 [Phytophthora cactorum]
MEKTDSPLDLLFFFMPRSLWSKIAKESNRYYDQHLNERIDRMYRKQREKGKEVTREEVMDKEAKQHKPIKGHETVRVIGLLMARMLYPHSADSRIIGLLHPSALSLLVHSVATCRRGDLAESCRTCTFPTMLMPTQRLIERGK